MASAPYQDVMENGRSALAAVRPRLKIRFPDVQAMNAALATESVSEVAMLHTKRLSVSVNVDDVEHALNSKSTRALEKIYDARVVEDFRYDLEDVDLFNPVAFSPDIVTAPSLDDVLALCGAAEAWESSRGRTVIIAIVDTGIDGTRPEFPAWKRASGSWAPRGEDPWTDWQGHGTMCAAIAAATRANGGAFDGFAPDATLMSCRTAFFDLELAAIYDRLGVMAAAGDLVVASNSFGIRTGTPPQPPADSDFLPALDDAINAGVVAVFSAGNYHELAGGLPHESTPNSVWLHKGRTDVLTVGASDLDNKIWFYSSRGPGQFHTQPGTSRKPDVVGATPRGGRIIFGSDVVVMNDGWGTSGCCPQAAGLLALLMSKQAAAGSPIDRGHLFDVIRSTADSIGWLPTAQGHGMINCAAAMRAI